MNDLHEREHPSGKVLVLGDDTRSFLTVVRSLGRKGLEVHVAPLSFSTPALASRYVRRVHRLPYYTGDGASWLTAVENLLIHEKFDLVIPCDDRFFIPFQLHQARLGRQARITCINRAAFEAFYDKSKTRELAASCGVPIARGRELRSADDAPLVFREFSPPYFLKAVSSYQAGNLYSRNKVLRFDSKRTLSKHIKTMDFASAYIVEEQFEGIGVGLGVLASEGKILQAFQYRRVHEPPSGGGSSYRASMAAGADIHLACGRMLEAVNFTGVAMFEFRYNPVTKAWILIEVNGRFWGGLPLAVAAGVDFPYHLYRLTVHGEKAPQADYKTDFFARNLINDFYCTMQELSEVKNEGLLAFLGLLLTRLGEFWRLPFGAEALDTLVRDDPRPGFQEIGEFVAYASGRLPGVKPVKDWLTRRRARKAVHDVRSAARGPLKVAFVCYGNICRSPFAGLLFEKRLRKFQSDGHKMIDIQAFSAGVYPVKGRASPGNAIEASRKWGLDLGGRRSNFLDDEDAGGADLIIAFDENNVKSIRERHPDITAPVILLGALSGPRRTPLQIEDPYGGDLARFVQIYDQIARGVDALLEMVSSGR